MMIDEMFSEVTNLRKLDLSSFDAGNVESLEGIRNNFTGLYISIDASKKISANSKFFKLAEDALFITYEAIELKKENDCGEKVEIRVKPAKQDEYHNVSKNPFRRPRTREALRFNTEDMLEVVSTYPDYIYKVRYMRKPKPIVLYDQEGLTINGVCHRTECELDSSLHRKILDRAVQLAALAYKQ